MHRTRDRIYSAFALHFVYLKRNKIQQMSKVYVTSRQKSRRDNTWYNRPGRVRVPNYIRGDYVRPSARELHLA